MSRPAKEEAPIFGRNLARQRKICGLSQAQLAELLKISIKAVGYYERRAINPNADFVKLAAEALATTPDVLLGYESSQKQKPGPISKLERQIQEVQQLPRDEQKFVSRFLDTVIAEQSRGD